MAAWTTQATSTADSSYSNTIVIAATGLDSRTVYQWRLIDVVSGTVLASNWTMTMPPSTGGAFTMIYTSDFHIATTAVGDGATDASLSTTAYANFKNALLLCEKSLAEGLPTFLFMGNDLIIPPAIAIGGNFMETLADYLAGYWALYDQLTADDVRTLQRVPCVYQWDDWDFLGNNSNKSRNIMTTRNGYTSADSVTFAFSVWDTMWRDQGALRSTDRGFSFEIAGVPFVFPDPRSNKYPEYSDLSTFEYAWGDFDVPTEGVTGNVVWGATQLAWLKSEMLAYKDRACVMMYSGNVFRDQAGAVDDLEQGGKRDSTGIYHKVERNDLVDYMIANGYDTERLIILSGDDHWHVIWDGFCGDRVTNPGSSSTTPNDAATEDYNVADRGLPFIEVMTVSAAGNNSYNAGGSPDLFGPGEHFSYATRSSNGTSSDSNASRPDCAMRFDIVSAQSGASVGVRMRYHVINTGVEGDDQSTQKSLYDPNMPYPLFDLLIDDNDVKGDFYWKNGTLATYVESDALRQTYPSENGPASGIRFRRTFIDDLHGTMHYEDKVERDFDERLRRSDDLDQPGRDEFYHDWSPRPETLRDPLDYE